jgi:uncharacterized protein YaiI (UPF0178 family)
LGETLKIWVDADACPKAVREVLFRASHRKNIVLTLVANQPIPIPPSKTIHFLQVLSGFDVADNEIIQRVEASDLVVTNDIPLASDVIKKGAKVITPRGERLSKQNIAARLTMRNFMESMRSSGLQTGGPSAQTKSDVKQFADQLDRILAEQS